MCGPGGKVKVAFCSVSLGLVCARWASHLEFSAPIWYDNKVNFYSMPKIAVFLADRWALPDLSGTRSLICLQIWKFPDIRLNLCERQCVTPNARVGGLAKVGS